MNESSVNGFLSVKIKVLFLFALLILSINTARAQDKEGLKISPAMIEEKADPGGIYNLSVTVTNISAERKTYYLQTEDIKSVTEDGFPEFAQSSEDTQFEIASWITLSVDEVDIEGGESATVPFTITVPEDASPGAHLGGVFFYLRPPKLRETASAIGYKVGTIVSFRISGDVVEEARIREFSTESTFYTSPNVAFNTKIENLGNVLVRPRGLIVITNMLGKQVVTVDVNDNNAAVAPNSTRTFASLWQYDGFAIGKYNATLSAVYGQDGRKTIFSTVYFWVLPTNLIFTLVSFLAGAFLLIFILVKMHIRKKLGGNIGRKQFTVWERKKRMLSRLVIFTSFSFFIILVVTTFFIFFA